MTWLRQLAQSKIIPQLTTRPILIFVRLLSIRIIRPPFCTRLTVQILHMFKVILTRSMLLLLFVILTLIVFFLFLFDLFLLSLVSIIPSRRTNSYLHLSVPLYPFRGIIKHLNITIALRRALV